MSLSRRLGRDTLERDVNRLKSFTADLGNFTMTDPLITRNIQPESTDTYVIGTSSLYYTEGWFLVLNIGDTTALEQGSIWGNGASISDPEIIVSTNAPSPSAADNNAVLSLQARAPGGSGETAYIDIVGGDGNASTGPYVEITAGSKTWMFDETDGFTTQGDLLVAQYIYHSGDADTYIEFTTDKIDLEAGGVVFLELTETAQDIIHFNSADADVDFQVDSAAGDGALFAEGSTGWVGIGHIGPDRLHHVEVADSATNSVTYAQRISHVTDGTAVAGFGTGIEFELEENDGSNRVAAIIEARWSDGGETTNADGYFDFKTMLDDGAAASRMVVGHNTHVGIGTSAPNYRLDVYHATDDFVSQFKSNDDLAGVIIADNDTTGHLLVKDGYMSIGAAATLDAGNLNVAIATGYVGIGTIAPGGPLEVTSAGNRIVVINNRIERWDSDTDNAAWWFNYQGYAGGSTRFRDMYIGDGKTASVMMVDGSAASVGIGTASPGARLHINQSVAAGALPVLHLEQDDVSEEFVRFTGTAAAGVLTQSIVDEGDQASETLEGWLKVYVVDEGNQITDQAYFVPLYTLSA